MLSNILIFFLFITLTGKQWGNKSGPPVLALHGYLDNASSFDKLLPLLNTSSVLCIDLPGHGHSSHLPPGICLDYVQNIYILRYLLKHCLKWSNFSFIGHSFGSSLCFGYAGIFPEDVKSMVNIDCSRITSGAIIKRTVYDLQECIDLTVSCDVDTISKGYTWEESLKHTYNSRKKGEMPLSLEACKIISKRGTKNVEKNLFRFSSDNRLKVFGTGRFTPAMNEALAKRIKCKILNITPRNGFLSVKSTDFLNKELARQLNVMEKESKHFSSVTVDGSHHVHLEQPENISHLINDFFASQ